MTQVRYWWPAVISESADGLETLALPPDVLLEQRRAQLEQLLGAVLEHPEDRLAVGNVERHNPGFAVVGALEPFGGVDELGLAKAGGEPEDGSVRDRDPCEPHDDDRTHVRARAEV